MLESMQNHNKRLPQEPSRIHAWLKRIFTIRFAAMYAALNRISLKGLYHNVCHYSESDFENAASFTARLPLLPDEADRRKWQQGTRQSAAHGRQSDACYRIFADRVFRPSRTGAARRLSARFSDASRSRHPFHRPDPHDRQSGLAAFDRFASMYSNCGFIGIPLVQSILGNEGVLYPDRLHDCLQFLFVDARHHDHDWNFLFKGAEKGPALPHDLCQHPRRGVLFRQDPHPVSAARLDELCRRYEHAATPCS